MVSHSWMVEAMKMVRKIDMDNIADGIEGKSWES